MKIQTSKQVGVLAPEPSCMDEMSSWNILTKHEWNLFSLEFLRVKSCSCLNSGRSLPGKQYGPSSMPHWKYSDTLWSITYFCFNDLIPVILYVTILILQWQDQMISKHGKQNEGIFRESFPSPRKETQDLIVFGFHLAISRTNMAPSALHLAHPCGTVFAESDRR